MEEDNRSEEGKDKKARSEGRERPLQTFLFCIFSFYPFTFALPSRVVAECGELF
jgi:hypothetical protein